MKNHKVVTDRLTVEVSSTVKNTTTDLEILENYKKANADFIAQPTEQIVTTKELAKILGVDVRTVNETVERLLESTFQKGEIKTISNGGRPSKVFTQKQATLIKQEIQKQTNNSNFKAVVKFINNSVSNKNVTLITSKRLIYLAKKFNTTIDKNVKADA